MLFYAVFKSNKDVVDALCTINYGLCTKNDGLCTINDGLCTINDGLCTINDGLCTKNDGLLYQTGPGQAESLLATENLS